MLGGVCWPPKVRPERPPLSPLPNSFRQVVECNRNETDILTSSFVSNKSPTWPLPSFNGQKVPPLGNTFSVSRTTHSSRNKGNDHMSRTYCLHISLFVGTHFWGPVRSWSGWKFPSVAKLPPWYWFLTSIIRNIDCQLGSSFGRTLRSCEQG